jgi:hypothetical protein
MTRRLSPLLCGLAVLLLAARPLRAADDDKSTTPVLLPGGGIADPDGKVGYFPSVAGGIEAVDLATGKVLWDSREANR